MMQPIETAPRDGTVVFTNAGTAMFVEQSSWRSPVTDGWYLCTTDQEIPNCAEHAMEVSRISPTRWMPIPPPKSMIDSFMDLLITAQAVSVDGGPLLTSWSLDPVTGDVDNAVVKFTWTDGEQDYSCTLDEGGIADGRFERGGSFVCQDNEDEHTEIRMFTLTQIEPE